MKKWIDRKWLGLVLLTGAIILSLQGYHMQATYAKEVVRFHVLANSDNRADQDLKLQVRNAVGLYVSGLLKGVDSKAETMRVIDSHLTEIEKVAKECVEQAGYTYGVKAYLEESAFPEKHYGKYHMPAGKYTALRVEIGQAKGHNWWCVMYPNMCFAGNTYEVVESKERQQMYETFTLYEYEKLIESPKKEVHFKYLKNLENKVY